MESYEAVVYDLDGTLVHLNVDWAVARDDVAALLDEHGIDDRDETLWELLERGLTDGFDHLVEQELAAHEREGARTSTALQASEGLPHDIPTGVCSLNCESACRLALDVHDLDGHVEAVVGRDTVHATKPDPEPLLETVDLLAASPDNTLFVGDTERDALTAERAGMDFRFVDEHLDYLP
jgi:phosphoglycolate phosphatase